MIRLLPRLLMIATAIVPLACVSVLPAAAAPGSILLSQDFNSPSAWPGLAAASPLAGMQVNAAKQPVGTIDIAGSSTASGAARLRVSGVTKNGWSTSLSSGLLPVVNTETNLGKLTLSLDHSVSSLRPITVRVESFDASRKRTGGRQTVVYPAAPNFWTRSAVELSDMKPVGDGVFKPTDPFVQITFFVESNPGETTAQNEELRIDNVAYAVPAYYVRPGGKDTNDGRTEATALADPQKAIAKAEAGDIIVLMGGTYNRAPSSQIHEGVLSFRRSGTPAAWISVKNYPGQNPVFKSDGWNAIKVGRGTGGNPSTAPALCYLEVRGLTVRGNADTISTDRPELVGEVHPLTNGNGISVQGNHETNTPHHLRFANNTVEYCSGGGIGSGDGDYVTIENNIIRNNSWWTIYATSGISVLGTKNFDTADNVYKTLIRNNVSSGNRCYVEWRQVMRISDGNGIIIDTTYVPANNEAHIGRTLIQSNLVFNNGGSGIHAFRGQRVDIVNNTAYLNGASPELNWGQIFVQLSRDIRVYNNIMVSRPNQPINSVGTRGDDQSSTDVVRGSNIYFGGLAPRLTGPNDLMVDPRFMRASTDPATADFRLQRTSPARGSAWKGAFMPLTDITGRILVRNGTPDRGAYQVEPQKRQGGEPR